jgi:hypothetical protein
MTVKLSSCKVSLKHLSVQRMFNEVYVKLLQTLRSAVTFAIMSVSVMCERKRQ